MSRAIPIKKRSFYRRLLKGIPIPVLALAFGLLTRYTSLVAVDRTPPRDQESILGFISEDLDALADRITANGGSLAGPIKSMPEHGVRVLFATDPEGHLSENVEMIAPE